jgi:hypothetical protein
MKDPLVGRDRLSTAQPCRRLSVGWGVEPGGRGLVGGVGTLLGPEESGRPE